MSTIYLTINSNTSILERIKVIGEQLDLIRVSRTEMGAYLCIAQNKVPPSISKRIILNVECKYNVFCFINDYIARTVNSINE